MIGNQVSYDRARRCAAGRKARNQEAACDDALGGCRREAPDVAPKTFNPVVPITTCRGCAAVLAPSWTRRWRWRFRTVM